MAASLRNILHSRWLPWAALALAALAGAAWRYAAVDHLYPRNFSYFTESCIRFRYAEMRMLGRDVPATDPAANDAVCWNADTSGASTHAVRGKTPNALGLYDITGNVMEWYSNLPGPAWTPYGGAWTSPSGPCLQVGRDPACLFQTIDSTFVRNDIGFRIAQTR